jgi:hypothetical protein
MSAEMLRAMDDILALSMLLKGTTPDMITAERQRQEDKEELRAREASQVKVRSLSCQANFAPASTEYIIQVNEDSASAFPH